jgi:hypothetical protein
MWTRCGCLSVRASFTGPSSVRIVQCVETIPFAEATRSRLIALLAVLQIVVLAAVAMACYIGKAPWWVAGTTVLTMWILGASPLPRRTSV